MEGGGFLPFGGDPEEILRGLREFAEQQAEGVKEAQREQFATLTLNTAVELTQAALAQVKGSSPIVGATIAERRDEAADQVDPLVRTFDDLQPVLDRLPAVFGFDGRRSYLVALLNPSELRYSGGASLTFAPLVFDQGKAEFGRSVQASSNLALLDRITWPEVPRNRFHRSGAHSLLNATFADRKSPIAYGYDEKLAIYFSQAPLFQTGGFGGFGGGGGGGGAFGQQQQGRPSGRGSLNDPDVIQGRKPLPPQPPSPPSEDGIPEEFRAQAAGQLPPPEMRPRVVLRFASDEKSLLLSGMLAGGSELAGKPAVIDVPVGKGHVVMFANNPMWRHQTHGSFSMLFNAALNFDHLHVGRPAPRRGNQPQAGQSSEDNDQ